MGASIVIHDFVPNYLTAAVKSYPDGFSSKTGQKNLWEINEPKVVGPLLCVVISIAFDIVLFVFDICLHKVWLLIFIRSQIKSTLPLKI